MKRSKFDQLTVLGMLNFVNRSESLTIIATNIFKHYSCSAMSLKILLTSAETDVSIK